MHNTIEWGLAKGAAGPVFLGACTLELCSVK
jgi:hypothetical protein